MTRMNLIVGGSSRPRPAVKPEQPKPDPVIAPVQVENQPPRTAGEVIVAKLAARRAGIYRGDSQKIGSDGQSIRPFRYWEDETFMRRAEEIVVKQAD